MARQAERVFIFGGSNRETRCLVLLERLETFRGKQILPHPPCFSKKGLAKVSEGLKGLKFPTSLHPPERFVNLGLEGGLGFSLRGDKKTRDVLSRTV